MACHRDTRHPRNRAAGPSVATRVRRWPRTPPPTLDPFTTANRADTPTGRRARWNYARGWTPAVVARCGETRTILISRRQPTASAYFCKVANEGECLRRPPPASNRATTEGCVAMRSATSAWVSPASCRARSNSSNSANSSSKLSYSRTNSGSCRHSRSISSCVFIVVMLAYLRRCI